MTRSLCAFAASLLLASAAAAGPMTADRQVTARAAHGYVVSANLNKLVFWRLPEREDTRARR